MPKEGRSRKIVDAPIDGKAEEKPSLFGWCSTNYHKECVVRFTGYKCSCKCHAEEKEDSSGEGES